MSNAYSALITNLENIMLKCRTIFLSLSISSICASCAIGQQAILASPISMTSGSSFSLSPIQGSNASPAGQHPETMLFGNRDANTHDIPAVTFTAGYLYTFTDSQTGHNRSLMGWSAMPSVRITKGFALQGDFVGAYVRSVYPGENRLSMSAGPRYTFAPHSRFTPFLYGEGGEIRRTSQANHNSDWNPVVRGGIGLEHKISRGLAFQLIPGEYTGQLLDDHMWEHSFTSRAGLTFNMFN